MAIGLLMPSVALAQVETEETPSRTYFFEGDHLEGAYQKPETMVQSRSARARFERLSSLKKSFLERTIATAADRSLER